MMKRLHADRDVGAGSLIGFYAIPLFVGYLGRPIPRFKVDKSRVVHLPGVSPKCTKRAAPTHRINKLDDLKLEHDLLHTRDALLRYCQMCYEEDEEELARAIDWHWSDETALAMTISVAPLIAKSSMTGALPDDVLRAVVGLARSAAEITQCGSARPVGMAFCGPLLKQSMLPNERGAYNCDGLFCVDQDGVPMLAIFTRKDQSLVAGDQLHMWFGNCLDLLPDYSFQARYADLCDLSVLFRDAGETFLYIIDVMVREFVALFKYRLSKPDMAPDAERHAPIRTFLEQRVERLNELGFSSERMPSMEQTWQDTEQLRASIEYRTSILFHIVLNWRFVTNAPCTPRDWTLYRAAGNISRALFVAWPWTARRIPNVNFHVTMAMSLHTGSGAPPPEQALDGIPHVAGGIKRMIAQCLA